MGNVLAARCCMLPSAYLVATGANRCNIWLRLSAGVAPEQSRVLLAWLPKQPGRFAVTAGGAVLQVGLSASLLCFRCLPSTALLSLLPFLLPANMPNTGTSDQCHSCRPKCSWAAARA